MKEKLCQRHSTLKLVTCVDMVRRGLKLKNDTWNFGTLAALLDFFKFFLNNGENSITKK